MANKSDMSLQKERKRVKMRTRISLLILLVAILQLLISAAVLIFGGEFRDLKEYSYHTLAEQTENRSTYIRDRLQEKSVMVQEYAEQLDSVVSGVLRERGASIADLKTDKDLDYRIIESSIDIVLSLLRHSIVNDVYFILDTGDLYADEGGDTAKAALYLQNANMDFGLENGDLLMELGFRSIAQDHGLIRDSNWSQYFTPDPEDTSNFDFYYKALQTAEENGDLKQNEFGYWGGFSKASPAFTPSMKYSLPLIAEDGTVYGILGVGLTKDAVLSALPFDDTSSDNICYVLGRATADNTFDVLAHSGSYSTLLGSANILHIQKWEEMESICDFDAVTGVNLLGSVQYMELYSGNTPYAGEQWALIAVADRSSVLQSLLLLQRMLAVSAVLSLIFAGIIAVPGCGVILAPLSDLSKQMKARRKYNEIVRFQPSNIYEIDEITDAITQLQINVHGFSSQVSKMISIADVGLGTFMYDRTDDSVFVGQSLVKVLRLSLPPDEDVVMSRREFLESIKNPEIRSLIAAGLGMSGGEIQGDHSEVHRINRLNGGTLWLRLGYTYSPNTAIGIAQDITDTMVEKNRIEYERDYDTLTGLLNRQAYYRRVEELFHNRDELNVTAFIMIDLDNLKYVNDTYGHDFGDSYIRTAAEVLKEFQEQGGIVSRLSGDEFNICLPGFSSKEEVREMIIRIHNKLMQSSCLLPDGTHFKISGSMGISWYPDDAESRELLMKYADFAMYSVKHSTKGGVAEFNMESYQANSVLLTGVEELRRVIEEESVRYAFQTIVSAKTGEVYGYEALMRVQSKIFQSPLELLRIAKTGAKLYEIERLTWTRSLADFQALIDAGRIEEGAHLFINSIANNRLEPGVEKRIEEEYPHLLSQVVIEILESESSDEDCNAHKVQIIQKWGGQLALDDFGTGYNSEYALLSLRPNIIKIDRSIVNGCDQDADRRMIIENLTKLARARGILALAEGVETKAEMQTVIACGVDLLQGYYLAHPLFEPEPIDPRLTHAIQRLAASSDNAEKDN